MVNNIIRGLWGFVALAAVGLIFPLSAAAQTRAPFSTQAAGGGGGGGGGGGPFLLLDASNGPVQNSLGITGALSIVGSLSDSVNSYLNIGENTILMNGGIVSWSSGGGIVSQAGSAKARLAQAQSGIVSAELIGYADSLGEVATYLGTSRSAAQGGDSTGVILTAFAIDVDGTPDVVASVTAQGEIQAAGDSGSAGGFTLSGCDGCSIRESTAEELRLNSLGTGGTIYLRAASDITLSASTDQILLQSETLVGTTTPGLGLGYDGARGYIDALVGDEIQIQDGDSIVPESNAFGNLGSETRRWNSFSGRSVQLAPTQTTGGLAVPACVDLADAGLYSFTDTATGDSNICACLYDGGGGAPIRVLIAQGGSSTKCL